MIDQSNSPSESDGQDDENHETEASVAQAGHKADETGKKKKKKKRKKSTRQQQNARSSEDNVEVIFNVSTTSFKYILGSMFTPTSVRPSLIFCFCLQDDEVERSVKEVNRILGEAAPAPSSHHVLHSSGNHKCSLGVEHKHLNPSNELKRIFGSKIIQAETRSVYFVWHMCTRRT